MRMYMRMYMCVYVNVWSDIQMRDHTRNRGYLLIVTYNLYAESWLLVDHDLSIDLDLRIWNNGVIKRRMNGENKRQFIVG